LPHIIGFLGFAGLLSHDKRDRPAHARSRRDPTITSLFRCDAPGQNLLLFAYSHDAAH
jgi:hypothetical protein